MKRSFVALVIFLLSFTLQQTAAQTNRALLIGINEYITSESQNPSYASRNITKYKNLRGAINDIEGFHSLLISKYNFAKENIALLRDKDATRNNILKELNNLVTKSSEGDFVFFYYAGHGSQVYNSKSVEYDKRDESIVPADSRLGAMDIRDKELAVLYNRILDKGAKLNVIMDCCHSGSSARGLPRNEITRNITPIETDINDPTIINPTPEERGAVIISASQDYEKASEIFEDSTYHGLFSYYLLKALRESPVDISITDLFKRTKAMMKYSGYLQEPVLAGMDARRKRALFGSVSDTKASDLLVAVSHIDLQEGIEVQGGIAIGLYENSELDKVDEKDQPHVKLRVIKNLGFTSSLCEVAAGDIKSVNTGDLFKVSKLASNYNNILRIWTAPSPGENELSEFQNQLTKLSKDKRIKFIDDPSETKPDYTIYFEGNGWSLIDTNNQVTRFNPKSYSNTLQKVIGKKASFARIFICYPPTKEQIEGFRKKIAEDNLTIELTDKRESANYFLIGRYLKNAMEYCLLNPDISSTNKNDNPLPARSDWFGFGDHGVVNNLLQSAIKINRVRGWLLLNNSAENSKFCYKLGIKKYDDQEVMTEGHLFGGDTCMIILEKDNNAIASNQLRYCYVFTVDPWGKSSLLYPRKTQGNIENRLNCNSSFNSIEIGRFKVVPPFGMDSYYLLTTTEPLLEPAMLEYSGVRTRGDKFANQLQNLISNIGYSTRGDYYNPENWSIEKCSFISMAKE